MERNRNNRPDPSRPRDTTRVPPRQAGDWSNLRSSLSSGGSSRRHRYPNTAPLGRVSYPSLRTPQPPTSPSVDFFLSSGQTTNHHQTPVIPAAAPRVPPVVSYPEPHTPPRGRSGSNQPTASPSLTSYPSPSRTARTNRRLPVIPAEAIARSPPASRPDDALSRGRSSASGFSPPIPPPASASGAKKSSSSSRKTQTIPSSPRRPSHSNQQHVASTTATAPASVPRGAPAPAPSVPEPTSVSKEDAHAIGTVFQCAGALRDALDRNEMDPYRIETLLKTCRWAQEQMPRLTNALLNSSSQNQTRVGRLCEVSDDITEAINLGGDYLRRIRRGNTTTRPGGSSNLPEDGPVPLDRLEPTLSSSDRSALQDCDVLTLICSLGGQEDPSSGLEAAMALLRLARDAARNQSDRGMILLRKEIISCGGPEALLKVFRAIRGDTEGGGEQQTQQQLGNYQQKVVTSLAVAYLTPSFIRFETNPIFALKIVACIRFLVSARAVSPRGEHISAKENFQAAVDAFCFCWRIYLQPMLSSEAFRAVVGLNQVVSPRRGRRGAVSEQRRETMTYRQLLEVSVSCVVHIAEQSLEHSAEAALLERTQTLVEQVCAVEITRSIAVREGILRVLVAWLGEKTKAREIAIIAMCYLTSIEDKYTAGWIHSEMVNKGAVEALVKWRPVEHKVRAATAQILASLCAAPHNRGAVVKANSISFLIGFLPGPSVPFSAAEVEFAGRALVQLAVGAMDVVLDEDDSDTEGETVIDDIVKKGAIGPFVSLARNRQGESRSIAVEALQVLSEDSGPARKTRRKLLDAGAVDALGIVLQDSVIDLNKELPIDRAFRAFPAGSLMQLREALSALTNILDPMESRGNTSTHQLSSSLIQECIESGGLNALLKIAVLPFAIPDHENDSSLIVLGPDFDLLEEACRSVASLAPLLSGEAVAQDWHSSGAHDGMLHTLHVVLRQLVTAATKLVGGPDTPEMHDRLEGLYELVLQGLCALAKSDPLKTWIVDRSLPYLVRSVGAGYFTGAAGMGMQALQALDFDDEMTVHVSGSDIHADSFCFQRSLLIQAMARSEIRQVLNDVWQPLLQKVDDQGLSKMVRTFSELFCNFAVDNCSTAKRERLIQQYNSIYGKMLESDHFGPDESQGELENPEGLLSEQIFPLSSFSTERQWVLNHRKLLKTAPAADLSGGSAILSKHVTALLDLCFPSKLLLEQIVPASRFSPGASFNFRALMLPERNYSSFQREGQVVSRICNQEAATLDGADSDVHWTLGFTNSSFSSEFAESLAQLLYETPVIRGLSFSRQGEEERGEGGSSLASLAGSLPTSVSHLTFDGVLRADEELAMLVRSFDTMGKRAGKDGLRLDERGNFSFLAVRRSPAIHPDVWCDFFGLFGANLTSTIGDSSRPLACLKSLDLSFNSLGDNLCASLLHAVFSEMCSFSPDELDLSGNNLREGIEVRRELKTARLNRKVSLRTLRLASNELNRDAAWLGLIKLVQRGKFGLRVLDLSSNEILLTESEEIESLVKSLQQNEELVQLNLSHNKLSSAAVDHVLGKLATSLCRNCGLGFLLLEGNDPNLTSQQIKNLGSFSLRSRKVLLERYIEELNGEQSNDDDELTVTKPPSHEPLFNSSNSRITVLFSEPLTYVHASGVLLPFPKLNFVMEREFLWRCMKEASRDIELLFDTANSDRLLAAMAKGCTCLHYSGHGLERLLPFENETGGTSWIEVEKVRQMIGRGGSKPCQLVFVSACDSGYAGQIFADAEVPHVVCCKQGCELNDVAALVFTRQFYLALAVGNTVRESFNKGRAAVAATPRIRDAEDEMEKFILLGDGNHDVPIFETRQVREWPIYLSQNAAAARIDELKARNLIQETPSPPPPEFFFGREVDMYRTLEQLVTLQRRLVSVVGEPGIGRSSLVRAVCHYINDRKSMMDLWVERIYYVKVKKSKKKNRFLALAIQLLNNMVVEGRTDPIEDGADVQDIVDLICRRLQPYKSLLVFDRVELLEDAQEMNHFKMLLSHCREVRSVKILMTNKAPLGIPSLGEHHIDLGRLNLEDTIKIFTHVCPEIRTAPERKKIMDALLPNNNEEGRLFYGEGLPGHIVRIFDALGRGIPSKVVHAAYSIKKDGDLPRLEDGSIRNEVPEQVT